MAHYSREPQNIPTTQFQAPTRLATTILLQKLFGMSDSQCPLRYKVYILRSIPFPKKTYTGYTTNLTARLKDHNRGHSPYTARFRPWQPEVIIAFPEKHTALAFEKYLKSHSGKAFASKRFK